MSSHQSKQRISTYECSENCVFSNIVQTHYYPANYRLRKCYNPVSEASYDVLVFWKSNRNAALQRPFSMFRCVFDSGRRCIIYHTHQKWNEVTSVVLFRQRSCLNLKTVLCEHTLSLAVQSFSIQYFVCLFFVISFLSPLSWQRYFRFIRQVIRLTLIIPVVIMCVLILPLFYLSVTSLCWCS